MRVGPRDRKSWQTDNISPHSRPTEAEPPAFITSYRPGHVRLAGSGRRFQNVPATLPRDGRLRVRSGTIPCGSGSGAPLSNQGRPLQYRRHLLVYPVDAATFFLSEYSTAAGNSVIQDRHSAGKPGRGRFDLDREATDGETGRGQAFKVGQFLHVTIADIHGGSVTFPDD